MLGSLGGVAQDFEPPMPPTHSILSDLRHEWEELYRCLGKLPGMRDFPIRKLEPWLPHFALVDVTGEPLKFQIRSMGAVCIRYARGDYTGRYIDECVDAAERLKVLEPYYAAAFTKQPIQRNAIYVRENESRLRTYRLYVPLATDGLTADTILVCVLGFEEFGQLGASTRHP